MTLLAVAPAAPALSTTPSADVAADSPSTRQAWSYPFVGALTVAVGSLALFPLWLDCFRLWSNDPLRSIGMAFPPLAWIGCFAAWRRLGFRADGTFWGLALITAAIALARVEHVSRLVLMVHESPWNLLHPGPVLLLYGVGATLLVAGPALLRAARAPLALLLLIDPVPHIFNAAIDLPLQQVSAATARRFAHLIGLQPTGEQLRMMFAPEFGMLIVPGCNGMRGALTLALLTLVFGYTQRVRPRLLAMLVPAALLVGYLLNLLRLCVLVIYYRAGLAQPRIQPYGETVDYVIGCSLFFAATAAIGLLLRSLAHEQRSTGAFAGACRPSRLQLARVAALPVLAIALALPQLPALTGPQARRYSDAEAAATLPPMLGSYRLTHIAEEHDPNGHTAMALGTYAGEGVEPIALGLWLLADEHRVASSKLSQGLTPVMTGALDTSDAQGVPIHFALSVYQDGSYRTLFAEAACSPDSCSDQIAASSQNRLVWIAPRLAGLQPAPSGAHLPVLLERRTEASDSTSNADLLGQFSTDAGSFAKQLDVRSLTLRSGTHR